ncbi:MAG: hypothetical protein M1817_003164 [Caeruleum heppii]|nr:MAG: hypothetical protein M1817_003164 [Caeruleum heppii]
MKLLPQNGQAPRPKVLIAEKVSPDGLALLQKTLDVHERKGLSPDELVKIIPEYAALIIRSETKVTSELLNHGKNLRVVARAGIGVDNVDVEAATKKGIAVINSPSGNIQAAAEHTIALLLAVARNIPDGCATLKAGKWERVRLVGVEVKGKTLGIIGLGKVGLGVARMANGLGMNVAAVDPYASPEIAASANVTLHLTLPALLPIVDFLTIHTPLIASTKGMISATELSSMKKGARILNVARGGVIDETALLEKLESGHIAGAGLDVFTSEPPTADGTATKLIAHPKVVATPHLGASTVEAQENVSIDVCTQTISILQGELPRSAVNAPLILPEQYRKLQPFVGLVEKMGALYTQYYTSPRHRASSSSAGSQPHRTYDLIYEGEIASIGNTSPLFAALVKGLLSGGVTTDSQNVNIVNGPLIAKQRGILISEQHVRDVPQHGYSSLVTLRARPSRSQSQERLMSSSGPTSPVPTSTGAHKGQFEQQLIQGYHNGTHLIISRIDRFATSFIPDGKLVICHNYDQPGKIGSVGGILGREGVNISSMLVAPRSDLVDEDRLMRDEGAGAEAGERNHHEALMILGVDREVKQEVVDKLRAEEGILDVSVVDL